MDEHWTGEFEHETITEENREAFATAMTKYATPEDAIVGGFNAQKLAGKPFRLPESLDKLPDDKVRNDFTSQAHKLLGIEHAPNVEALADLDLKVGLAEGHQVDENLGNAFKQFVVENKVPKAVAQKAIGFHNQMMAQAREAMAAQAEAAQVKAATDTNAALIAHFGSEAKVKDQSELLRRAIKNSGITAEEYERVGEVMADSMLTKDPVMARVMLKLLAPLAASSSHEGGGAGEPPPGPKDPDAGSPSYKALGWQ
jgi:hypothetical protein